MPDAVTAHVAALIATALGIAAFVVVGHAWLAHGPVFALQLAAATAITGFASYLFTVQSRGDA